MTDQERTGLFTAWVNEYADLLLHYTLQRFDDRSLCEDIVQDTFLKAWKGMENYRGEMSPKNWLFLILKSRIIDQYRKMAASLRHIVLKDDFYFDENDHWKVPAYPEAWQEEDILDNKKDFQLALNGCTNKLKAVQQVIFTMKYVEGLKSRDICRMLNISNANYWVLMHRAKVQLRHCLQENWLNE